MPFEQRDGREEVAVEVASTSNCYGSTRAIGAGSRAVDDLDEPRMASSGGRAPFPICPVCDAHVLEAVIDGLKPRHPTQRLFERCDAARSVLGCNAVHTAAAHLGLSARQFHADAGDAEDRGAVVADQPAREAVNDRFEGMGITDRANRE